MSDFIIERKLGKCHKTVIYNKLATNLAQFLNSNFLFGL